MTPSDSLSRIEEPRRIPFWGYEDLALLLGAVIPSLAVASLLMRIFKFTNAGVRTVAFECLFYALLLGAMYLLIAWRYGEGFWRSFRLDVRVPLGMGTDIGRPATWQSAFPRWGSLCMRHPSR